MNSETFDKKSTVPQEIPPAQLNESGCFVLAFPNARGRNNLQLLSGGELFLELDVHLLLQLLEVIGLLDMAEHVLHKGVQYVQTMDLVAL